jgi:hypothetical protein
MIGQPPAQSDTASRRIAQAQVRSLPSHTRLDRPGRRAGRGKRSRARIDLTRNQARDLLDKVDSFTEPVVAQGNRKLFRARFTDLEQDQAD